MKISQHIALCALVVATGPSLGATCPPEAAARLGAQNGYNRDKNAAIDTEKRENASSETIGKCIGGITSVIVVPAFPSLSDIFARAADKVCHVASDKIREATTLPGFTVPGLPTTSIPVRLLPPVAPIAPVTPPSLWERIWR